MKESSNSLTEKCFESIKKLTFNNGQNHISWVDHRFSIIVQFNEQWPIQSFFCFKCPNSVNYLNQTVKIGLDSLNTNSIFEFRNANKKKNDVLVESSIISYQAIICLSVFLWTFLSLQISFLFSEYSKWWTYKILTET